MSSGGDPFYRSLKRDTWQQAGSLWLQMSMLSQETVKYTLGMLVTYTVCDQNILEAG